MSIHASVHLRHIRKSYREGDTDRRVFDDLELVIPAGACVALLGRSGSGKSTLLNLVAGIDLPEAGEVQVGDRVINRLTEYERTGFRRRRLGFIFQFFNLIPTLTVEENVLLPLELNRMNTDEDRRHAFELLEQVGLSERRHSFPERLSGGEQQRLAIVRALAHRPPLLLADEPTGNLDDDTGARVMELLFALQRRFDLTVLMVTHSREIAARAERVLVLEAGRVRESAP